MEEMDQRIHSLRMRLHQEENLDNLLLILQEIDGLVKEHPTENTYSLLTFAYREISDASSEDSALAHDLMLYRLLPWVINSGLPDSAHNAQGDSLDVLREWLNQFSEDRRVVLLNEILDVLEAALRLQPTEALCWTIISIGYRRHDIVTELWEVVRQNDDQLGDVALRALERLGMQGADRQRLLDELHRRIAVRMTVSLLGSLIELADVSTIPIISQCLKNLANDEDVPFARTFALKVLANIADAHDTDQGVQVTIWNTIVELYEAESNRYTFDIYLNDETAPHCNNPNVPQQLIRWLEYHPGDAEDASYRRYLLYLRLSECVRPHQLSGLFLSESSKGLTLIQRDVHRNTQNTSRWSTRESHTKERAWDSLLYIGDGSVLTDRQFKKVVVQEASGFMRGKIMDLLACFRWKRLPDQVITWITEKVDLKRDTASQELPFRRGAEHLARSAGTRQAFDALLAFGMTYEGETLRETVDTLANVSLTLVRHGEPDVIETLLSTIEYGDEKRHQIAAMRALDIVAINDLLPLKYLSRIIAVLNDEKRDDFERSYLVQILGSLSRLSLSEEILEILQKLADSKQANTANSALEALAQSGTLLEFPNLLEKRLLLFKVGEQWNCPPTPNTGRWLVGMICTVYQHDHKRFAPAIATLIENLGVFELPILLRALSDIHSSTSQSLPIEVYNALILRLQHLKDSVITTPAELLQTCVHLLPDKVAEQAWEYQWEMLTPGTRIALAEALGNGRYMTGSAQTQATKHLLFFTRDAQYSVRRAAYRGLANIAPDVLLYTAISWTFAPTMELRRRAAETLIWLSSATVSDIMIKALEVDPDPLVRESLTQINTEKRQHVWAIEYLARIRSTYGKSNRARLAIWRYAHALTMIGDDTTVTELQTDLVARNLASHERQWLLWMFNNTQEHWKKAMEKWPKPWLTWAGKMVFERSQVAMATGSIITGICYLYQHENEITHVTYWGGAFWPDISTSMSEQKTLELILTNGRRGKVVAKDIVGNSVWLLEGIGQLK